MVGSTRVSQAEPAPCADDLVIRSLTPDDAKIFGELLYEAFKDSIHSDQWESAYDAHLEANRVFARKTIFFDASFIALKGATPVSMSIVETGPSLSYIGTVAHYRRCGLIGDLVKRSLRAMHSKGFVEVYLHVAAANKNAMSRYRSLGFEVFDARKPT